MTEAERKTCGFMRANRNSIQVKFTDSDPSSKKILSLDCIYMRHCLFDKLHDILTLR